MIFKGCFLSFSHLQKYKKRATWKKYFEKIVSD